MCHLVRDEHAAPRPASTGALPGERAHRPRWVVGAAVTMVGGLALAAWVDLQPVKTGEVVQPTQPPAAAAAPLQAVKTGSGPADGITPVHDEVPTAAGQTRGSPGYCHHGT